MHALYKNDDIESEFNLSMIFLDTLLELFGMRYVAVRTRKTGL